MVPPTPIPVGATALRPVWTDLPAQVRQEIQTLAGGEVVEARSQGSGFTPGFASRLVLADGQRLFVKAASSAYPWMIEAYQAEVDKLRLLPAAVPAPPVIFDRLFQVDGEDWLIAGFTDIDGRPPLRPWREEEARDVLRCAADLGRTLTPPPTGADWIGLDIEFAQNGDDWAAIAEHGWLPADIIESGAPLARDFLGRMPRTTLIHCDLRDDNVIIGSDGRVHVCDWNFPVLGPSWTDTVTLAISMHGDGLDAERLLAETGVVDDPALVDGFLAMLLGYFTMAGRRPEVDNSPYLRTHQRWYADATGDWLRRRIG
ncbi:aminoglycoside phosphotransferase family protein [Microlunatus sp. GCM10028923]|uniref:aminoglycoside phosphotransferase family protein n=1 Tax=Microlunatus sp. GCM10028923 TaxID=3273400 RepID=UPI003607374F